MCLERLYPLHKQRLWSLTNVTRCKRFKSDGKQWGIYTRGGQQAGEGGMTKFDSGQVSWGYWSKPVRAGKRITALRDFKSWQQWIMSPLISQYDYYLSLRLHWTFHNPVSHYLVNFSSFAVISWQLGYSLCISQHTYLTTQFKLAVHLFPKQTRGTTNSSNWKKVVGSTGQD